MARPNYQIPLLRQLEDRMRWLTGHPVTYLIDFAYSVHNPEQETITDTLKALDRAMRTAMWVDL